MPEYVDNDEIPMSKITRRDLLTSVPALAIGGLAVAESPTASTAPTGSLRAMSRLTVNGKTHSLELDPRTTVLDALREHLQLTGTKKGCDQGQCGACTILVNGQRINSCLALAVMHDGDEITTIEGLAKDGTLHPMQAAF